MAATPEIDGYSDLLEVARGGFGTVYRAHQVRHGRVVALKVLDVHDLDDRGRRRFERECVAMGSLSWHPNVVALFDSGIAADGHPWLAMEYLEAGSLGDRLVKDGPLPWPAAVVAGVQVAGALGAAHAAGILHRDLKPENLLIGPFGEVELGDFGIAAVEGAVRTTTGHASFTVAHVAPELLRGERPDERSDLYGLASAFYTLIAGAPPLAGDPDEPFVTVMARVLSVTAPRLHGVPDDLAELLGRTLAKDPADRPRTAADLGRALQRIQASNGQAVTDLRFERTEGSVRTPVDPHGDGPTGGEPRGDAPKRVVSSTPPVEPGDGDPRPTVRGPRSGPGRGDPRPTAPTVAAATPPVRVMSSSAPSKATGSGHGSGPEPTGRGPLPDVRALSRAALIGLVGVVVLAGVWYFATARDSGGDTATSTTITTSTTATTAAAAPHDISTLPVFVANGSGVVGVAGQSSGELESAGYNAVHTPGSAPDTAATQIWYDAGAGGNQADAAAVATVLGLSSTVVEPLPADPGFDTRDAAVVVALGADLAKP